MRFVLDLLYLFGFMLASPWLAWRALRQRGQGRRTPRESFRYPPGGIWLHGSSVGEVSLIRPLVEHLERARPGVPLVISSHTATGVEAARRAYPGHSVFRFPPDFSFVQRRLLARLEPALIVIVESDLWPNQLLAARDAGVAVAIVNGKLSERSMRRHRWSRLVPTALRHAALVAVQNEEHAARFAELGVPRASIAVTGNMKYDLTADEDMSQLRSALRERLACADKDVLVLGGSLHLPEDEDLLAAFAATRDQGHATRLVLVPRYPGEAQTVMSNVRRAGLVPVSFSALGSGSEDPADPKRVIVVDVLGELRNLYAAADLAFVGGSLYFRGANKGGHNLMEPAILGVPVLFGPWNFSFRDTVADLLAADAGIEVADREALIRAVTALAASAPRRRELGRRARAVVLNGQGAAARNLALLLPLLDDGRSCSGLADDAQCRHQTPSHPSP